MNSAAIWSALVSLCCICMSGVWIKSEHKFNFPERWCWQCVSQWEGSNGNEQTMYKEVCAIIPECSLHRFSAALPSTSPHASHPFLITPLSLLPDYGHHVYLIENGKELGKEWQDASGDESAGLDQLFSSFPSSFTLSAT